MKKICTAERNCGCPRLRSTWAVGGVGQRSAALSLTLPDYCVTPLNGFLAPSVWVWPVDRRNGAGGWVFPGRACPAMQPAGCPQHVCAAWVGKVGFGIVKRQTH
jgi:hypothetical protein